MGDFDSYVAYINFEYQQVVDGGYILAGAFETTNTSYDLSYYAFNLKMFEKPYAYGFATQMGEDPTTGEPVEQFVWPLEMGTMIEKTYTYGEPSSAQPEEVQARAKAFEPVSFEAAKKQIADIKGLAVCPNCKESVNADVAYCPKCGTKLEEEAFDVEDVLEEVEDIFEDIVEEVID